MQADAEDPGPAPEDLAARLHYAGSGSWVSIRAGAWGTGFAQLDAGRAQVVLSPRLVQRPELLGACLLNTLILNLCIAAGLGMLHASCLQRGGRVLLLVAPHNAGKSTTALRLVLAGWQLVTDSMVFLQRRDRELLLLGFPVGRIKLRSDVVDQFPQVGHLLQAEQVRSETKYAVDLGRCPWAGVSREAVVPRAIELCLLQRRPGPASSLEPVSSQAVVEALMENSLYYDSRQVWQVNLSLLEEVVARARCHRLTIGSDGAGVVAAVEALLG